MLDPEEYQLVLEEAGFEDAEVRGRSLEVRGRGLEIRGRSHLRGGLSKKGEETQGKGRGREVRGPPHSFSPVTVASRSDSADKFGSRAAKASCPAEGSYT